MKRKKKKKKKKNKKKKNFFLKKKIKFKINILNKYFKRFKFKNY